VDILGDNYVVLTRAGDTNICLAIYDRNPAYGIPHNSPAHMQFMMHLTDGSGKRVPQERVSFEQISVHYLQKKQGIKFRKVSSTKSIDDCATKLINWIKIQKSNLDELISKKELDSQKGVC
jgi:hypothetical protein